MVRTRNPQNVGDDQSQDEIIGWALKGGVVAHTQIVSREELTKESEDLAEKAYFKFIPTPKAVERPENEETSGMMLKAASSIIDTDNTLLGVLYGGILLTRNYAIVDRVKEIVYKGANIKGTKPVRPRFSSTTCGSPPMSPRPRGAGPSAHVFPKRSMTPYLSRESVDRQGFCGQ